MSTVQERIARGMALLDEKLPGWREKVNLAMLDMGSVETGLLEQISGGLVFYSYYDTLTRLGLHSGDGCKYGFDIQCGDDDIDEGDEEWGQLTDAWIQALTTKEVSPTK